ncbi:MAG: B12-binding domain-containing radical SAM protein [Endomicrobiales bacterium]
MKCPWWVRYCPPYILAFFATYLRSQGHEAFCFDLNNALYHAASPENRKYWDDRDYYSLWENPSFVGTLLEETRFDRWVDRILETGAEVIAFDTHTPSALTSLELARRIKEKDAARITVFMGHKASRAQMAFSFIREPQVDYVCPGEADLALAGLLKELEAARGEELPAHPGFLSKKGGEIVDGGATGVVRDLDSLPFPDYADFADDIRLGRYSQPERLDILDSRGCINACHFCYERLFWGKHRCMSGGKVFEQVRAHHESFPRVNYFYFNGLLLNGNLKNLEEFCDRVIESGLPLRWAGQAVLRPDMTLALLLKMRRAGCSWLGYGVESGSQGVLDRMNKRFSVAKAAEVLKNTREAGIPFQINMMFGFPTETAEEFQESLAFLVRVRPYVDSILASQSFFTLEKGTYVREHPEEFGITGADHHLFWKSNEGKNDYAERFRRYEEFCRLALKLGIPETSGVLRVKPDKWSLLGQYYRFEKEYGRAAECFGKSLALESKNETTLRHYEECARRMKNDE